LGVMNYIDVKWRHSDPECPVRLVSELDATRKETRKLEFFPNGSVGYACANVASADTMLGLEPVPPLEEINANKEFEGVAMSAAEFEQLWRAHGPT
jgi:hypothetical protein